LKPNIFFLSLYIIFNSLSVYSQTFSEEPIIRVRIIFTLDSLSIVFNEKWLANDRNNFNPINFSTDDSVFFRIDDDHIIINNLSNNSTSSFDMVGLKSVKQNGTIRIKNVPYGIGWWWQGIEDRVYEGEIEISINENDKFDVIITLPLENYLCGVVPYEIGNDAPLESLKAQVIAARSETVSALISGKYKGDNFDICADVECQVFAGNNKRTTETDKAVFETRGLCLLYDNIVIGAYYASNCGGCSENVENVWKSRSGAVPYWSSHFDSDAELKYDPKNNPEEWIKSNPDVFCNPYFHPELSEWSKKNFRWQVEMTNKELSNNLNEIKQIGILNEIKILERGNSGRIIKARFIGSEDSLDLNSELEIRKIRKPPFRSSCFIYDKNIISDSSIIYNIIGAGWGHGVGMCQSGAVARAFSGQTFEQILNHYFRETEIKSAYKK
jgi:SpoIID/LytB domain protein